MVAKPSLISVCLCVQLSVSCHLLKRHFDQFEIYKEATVYYSRCPCVFINHNFCEFVEIKVGSNMKPQKRKLYMYKKTAYPVENRT